MPIVILHIVNDEPVLGEMDEMPTPQDTILVVRNPRRRDGKDLPYVDATVTTVIWPMHRLNFLEILPSAGDDEIITFVRE
ncbi:MAG: hypothetical protein ROW52_13605 [Anaerolineaceae bacterium]|jgi:hypothetical protein